jgi:hypothetical protein
MIDKNLICEDLMGIDPNYESEVKAIEKKFNCAISVDIEKVNVLQETHYYEIVDRDNTLHIEVESGINRGTHLISCEWGFSTKEDTKEVNVLTDIVLDDSMYIEGSLLKRKAQAVLSSNKEELFEFHRKDNYDNYVTGGNSKMKKDKLLSELHLEYIYKTETVYRNFK